jgi:hypothetical protein
MKKLNLKKRVSQLMAGIFGLALMGGLLLTTQTTYAQSGSVRCISGDDMVCLRWISGGTIHIVYGGKGAPKPELSKFN